MTILVTLLKVSEDIFDLGTSMLLQNTLHICSNIKYVVHGLFKINQLTISSIIEIFQFHNHVFLKTMT